MYKDYPIIDANEKQTQFNSSMQFFRNTPIPLESNNSSQIELDAPHKTRWSSPRTSFKLAVQDENTSSLAAKETCGSLNSTQFSAQSGSLKEKFLTIDDNLRAFDVESQEDEPQCTPEAEAAALQSDVNDSQAQDDYAASVLQGSQELASLFKKTSQPTTEIMQSSQTRKVFRVQTLIAPKAKAFAQSNINDSNQRCASRQIKIERCSPDFAQNCTQ